VASCLKKRMALMEHWSQFLQRRVERGAVGNLGTGNPLRSVRGIVLIGAARVAPKILTTQDRRADPL
jgi:hypothetical protein